MWHVFKGNLHNFWQMIGRGGCGGKGNREGAGGKHEGSENERCYDFVNTLIFQKEWFL